MANNPDESHRAVARRLTQLRLALGYETQAELCREIDCKKNRWSQYENPISGRTITHDIAVRLRRRFGVTLDWIYCGDLAKLPNDIVAKLHKAA